MILNEGGNVFPDVTPFDHANVPEILSKLQRAISDTGIRLIPVGSAATPKPGKQSGDMDVIADEEQVLGYFNAKDAKSARRALNDYVAAKGFQTAQSGINVHVRVPIGDEAHQVDIMVTPKAEKVSKFHTHDIPDKSPYKGVNKQLMLAILAKSKGFMWSAWQGLFSRTPEGKKGDFVTDELDGVAQLLLGNNASAKDLGSVESILNALPKDQADALLARAKEDPNWKEVSKESVVNRLRQLAGLNENDMQPPPMPSIQGLTPGQPKDLGDGERVQLNQNGTVSYSGGFGEYIYDKTGKAIKYNSPNFAGLSKSTDLTTNKTTTSYGAGPMNIKQEPDGEVDGEYQLGPEKIKMSNRTARTDAYKESLDELLRIARLR